MSAYKDEEMQALLCGTLEWCLSMKNLNLVLIDLTISGTVRLGQLGNGDGHCYRNEWRRIGGVGGACGALARIPRVDFDGLQFLRQTRTNDRARSLPTPSMVWLYWFCARNLRYRLSDWWKTVSSGTHRYRRNPLPHGCIDLVTPRRFVFGAGDQMMALTLEADQRLESVGLVALFDNNRDMWLEAAKQTKEFISGNFPEGSKIRRDDVAKALIPILEVNEILKDALHEFKLRGKFWIKDFADLIIDRTWDDL